MSWWDNLTGKEKAIGAGLVLGLIALVYAMRHKTAGVAAPTGPYVLSDVPQGTIPVVGAGGVYPTPTPGPTTPPATVPPGPLPIPPGATGPPIIPPIIRPPVGVPSHLLPVTVPPAAHPPVYNGDWGSGSFQGVGQQGTGLGWQYTGELLQQPGGQPVPGWPFNGNPPAANPTTPNIPPAYSQVPAGMESPGTVPTYTPAPAYTPPPAAVVMPWEGSGAPVTIEDLMNISEGSGGNRFEYTAV